MFIFKSWEKMVKLENLKMVKLENLKMVNK